MLWRRIFHIRAANALIRADHVTIDCSRPQRGMAEPATLQERSQTAAVVRTAYSRRQENIVEIRSAWLFNSN
jgi:hypothetical protein